MAVRVLPSYPNYRDTTGGPLENGYIYIGTAGADAETNPISVFWDEAGTIPASQPIRTVGGYPSYSGSPGMLYVTGSSDFSLTVRTVTGTLVYSALNNTYGATSTLGSMATQNSNAVSITGGSISGLSSALEIASGGTGAGNAASARANLDLGPTKMANQDINNVQITGGTVTGITDLAVADGGTGASTASAARTNLGLGALALLEEGAITTDTTKVGAVFVGSSNLDGAGSGVTLPSGGTWATVAMAFGSSDATVLAPGTVNFGQTSDQCAGLYADTIAGGTNFNPNGPNTSFRTNGRLVVMAIRVT